MQQVKSEAFLAGARMVDPRALPAVIPAPRRKLQTRIDRLALLHGRLVRRIGLACLVLAAGVTVYQLREQIGLGAATLIDMAQGRAAAAGLAIGEISITGQTLTGEQAIFDALGIPPDTSTVAFDVEAARQRIAALPAIESVSVRKTYPGDITVAVTEKVPVARWRVDGITFVIDSLGEQIGEDRGAYSELPLVVGDGANDDAMVMIRALDQFPSLKEGLWGLSRIADRRWDLIYDSGLRVQLPELGAAQALQHLVMYQTDYQLLDRDVTVVDLRVPNLVAVQPTLREEAVDDEDEDTTP